MARLRLHTTTLLSCTALFAVLGTSARASEVVDEEATPLPSGIEPAVGDGLFAPLTLSGNVGANLAVVSGMGGYDSARHRALASTGAEVRLWGPVALRVGAEYTGDRTQARPTAGIRAQVFRQQRHGVDGAVSVFYRPEGFTEAEGEVETFLSVSRRGQFLTVAANLVYGQDPEGNERDGEVRLYAQHGWKRFALGLDSRARFALGAQKGASAMAEPRFDLLAGPVATATVGSVALFAEASPSVVRMSNGTFIGVAVMSGLGTVF
jgi:hypothetical protein